MASVAEISRGRRSVFDVWTYNAAGKRQRIRIGKVGSANARQWGEYVTHLEDCRRSGLPPFKEGCTTWLASMEPALHAKLVLHGLASPRAASSSPRTLFAFIDRRLEIMATERKPGSVEAVRKTRTMLERFFPQDLPISAMTMERAEDWVTWMRTKALRRKSADAPEAGLSEATVRLHVRNAKAIFKRAVAHKLIAESPFTGLASQAITGVRAEPVPADVAMKVLAELPTAQQRLYFALARFAGLRMPSEGLALTWDRVDWISRKTMHVYSPKLHRRGKDELKAWRWVPIAPVVAECLQAVYDAAAEGERRVLTIDPSNVDNAVGRAASRAGVPAWRRTFDTLRESCIVDWNNTLPANVVPLIAGHSKKVEQDAYLSLSKHVIDLVAKPQSVAPRVAAATEIEHSEAVIDDGRTLSESLDLLLETAQCGSLPEVGSEIMSPSL